jgi:hypothetical protein
MKAVLASNPWMSDRTLHHIPWREHEPHIYQGEKKKLTVGVM